MTKIEAIIRPERLDAVQDALDDMGVRGMTVLSVRGQGKQRGVTHRYRGAEYTVNLLEKVKIEVVVADGHAAQVARVMADAARTGEIGDGKIFLTRIDDALRVRTGETGEAALT
jgi:nitrogen regulatory protein P-II 1